MKQKRTGKNIYKLDISDNNDTDEYNESNRKGKTFKVT